MEIKGSGSQPSTKGPEAYFTGNVRIDPLFQASDPGRVLGALVTSSPALVPHGIYIRSDSIYLSRPAAAGCSVGAAPKRTSGQGM
jgi:hypothetical protein